MGIQDLEHLLPHDIQVEPFTGQDKFGEETYGTATTYKGRVELKNRMIRDETGREAVARGRVFLSATVPIGTKDRMTLPAGYPEPKTPPILAVMPIEGQTGIDHLIVMFG